MQNSSPCHAQTLHAQGFSGAIPKAQGLNNSRKEECTDQVIPPPKDEKHRSSMTQEQPVQ